MNAGRLVLSVSASLIAILLCSCASSFSAKDQKRINDLYYSNQLDKAAEESAKISTKEDDRKDQEALLWHLEAGSINMDAGKMADSIECLARAEKLLYRFDGQGRMLLHRPGNLTYTGMKSDRITLGMLKAFYYFSKDKLEDSLVEVRRTRVNQFNYLLNDADPDILAYDTTYAGTDAAPYKMKDVLADQLKTQAFNQTGMNQSFQEYRERKRPELSIMFNPMAFYLSAIGYYWEDNYDEAVIDLKYLHRMWPENELFARDYATLLKLNGDPVPDYLRNVKAWDHMMNDNVVFVIYAQGKAPRWENKTKKFQLPNCVSATWTFPKPVFFNSAINTIAINTDGKRIAETIPFADLNDIMRDEYWQLYMPEMVNDAVAKIKAQTAAHEAAKANLAITMATPYPNAAAQAMAIASAQAMVEATKHIDISNAEWRAWSTVARHYQLAHFKIPDGRSIELYLPGDEKEKNGRLLKQIQLSQDSYRAVIYVREINGKYVVKVWELRD